MVHELGLDEIVGIVGSKSQTSTKTIPKRAKFKRGEY